MRFPARLASCDLKEQSAIDINAISRFDLSVIVLQAEIIRAENSRIGEHGLFSSFQFDFKLWSHGDHAEALCIAC